MGKKKEFGEGLDSTCAVGLVMPGFTGVGVGMLRAW